MGGGGGRSTCAHALGAGVLVALLAGALPARADDGAGAFRLGLAADAFDWHTQDWFRPGGANSHREGFDLVLVAPHLQLQLAGQVIPEVAVGALVSLGWGTLNDTGSADQWAATYMVEAMAEYALFPGQIARPFARATIGVGGAERDHPETTLTHYSVLLFELAGAVGVHLFPVRSFSVSPYVQVYYSTGPGTETAVAARPLSISTTYVAVSVGLELIGWIGGTAPAPAPAARETPVHERPAAPPAPTFRDGVLEVPVAFSGGTRDGSLSATPARDADVVEVRFAAAPSLTELQNCETIEIVEGETRTSVALSVERVTVRERARFVLSFEVTPSALALLASRRASLEACDQHFDVSTRSARTVLSFLSALLALRAEPGEAAVDVAADTEGLESAPIPPAPVDAVPPPDAADADAAGP